MAAVAVAVAMVVATGAVVVPVVVNNAQTAAVNVAGVMAAVAVAVAVAMDVATGVATSPKKPAQRWVVVKTAAAAKKRVPNRHPQKVGASRDKTDAVARAPSASRAALPLARV